MSAHARVDMNLSNIAERWAQINLSLGTAVLSVLDHVTSLQSLGDFNLSSSK